VSISTLQVSLTGIRPLLMHRADELSDVLAPITKQIKALTSKRRRTEEDEREIRRLEWHGGLYWREGDGPYMPTANLERCLRDAAVITRQGKDLVRALVIPDDAPLIYRGPRDVEALWADPAYRSEMSVKVGMARTIRCRPKFDKWEIEFTAHVEESVLAVEDFTAIVDRAGLMTGLGDYRPRFGRFTAQVTTT
jgi:hypothetical protein